MIEFISLINAEEERMGTNRPLQLPVVVQRSHRVFALLCTLAVQCLIGGILIEHLPDTMTCPHI